MITLADWLRWGVQTLAEAGIEDAKADAKFLLLCAADIQPVDYILQADAELDEEASQHFRGMIQRRAEREPVSLILGEVEFLGLRFKTDERALAPRADSERLVELAIRRTEQLDVGKVVDLGTGSGCLILSFLSNRPAWSGTALDLSADALSLARENAASLGVASRMRWIEGSWLDARQTISEADLVLSNPPYIPHADIAELDPEVRDHDPHLALDGGADGLTAYRDILGILSQSMKPGARLVFEIGFDQGPALEALIHEHGFAEFAVHKDFSGHDRVVEAVRE